MKRPPPRPPSTKPPRRTAWDDPALPKPTAARDPFGLDPLAPDAAPPSAPAPATPPVAPPVMSAPPSAASAASPAPPLPVTPPRVDTSMAASAPASSSASPASPPAAPSEPSTSAPRAASPPVAPPVTQPPVTQPPLTPSLVTPPVTTAPPSRPAPSRPPAWMPGPPASSAAPAFPSPPAPATAPANAIWMGLALLVIGAAAGWLLRPVLFPPPPPAPPLPSVALDSLAWRGARLRARLERLDPPTSAEEAPMRQPRTAPYRDHLTLGDSLGVPPLRGEGDLAALAGRGRLVPLATNDRYVVRVLEHSKPYVTPATLAWLDDASRRFQQRLRDAGLPPFRLVVSSALRTADLQADLRRVNRNAASGRSSHEYGVSVDIDHTDFRAPAYIPPLRLPVSDAQADLANYVSRLHTDDLARAYWPSLFGVLTRVMAEEQAEERALVLLESEQPVFHVTVGRIRRAAPLTGEPSAGDTSGG